MRRAQRLDPLSLLVNSVTGIRLYDARRYDEAIRQLRLTLEMEPHFFPALLFLAMTYQRVGQHEEAIELLEEVKGVFAGQPIYEGALATALAAGGREEEAEATLQRLRESAKE
jgi:tetratricopeptide (TPR) repeat protein